MGPPSAHEALMAAKDLVRSIRAMQNSLRAEKSQRRRAEMLESMVHETKILQRLLDSVSEGTGL